MAFVNTNLIDFIDHIINYEHIDDIINQCTSVSEKGFVYERHRDLHSFPTRRSSDLQSQIFKKS